MKTSSTDASGPSGSSGAASVTTAPKGTTPSPTRSRSSSRLEVIDFLRGVAMILMALDHTRGFLSNADFNPLDVTQTTPALYMTRWVTHFCAPIFVFLAGTAAFLSMTRGKTRAEMAWFLLTRGVWLVVLEFTLVHLGWCLSFEYHYFLAQVIWAIGGSMILMAVLVFLPTWAVTLVGVLLIAGHNLFDNVDAADLGHFRAPWIALVSGSSADGSVELPGVEIYVAYPVLPWLGIIAVGFGLGQLWTLDRERRQQWLLWLGGGVTLLFLVLRTINGYGNYSPWSPQATPLLTLLSFLNCDKYPPSLLYVLMTLGPSLMLLAICDRPLGRLGQAVVTFGRVPLFYYLLHLPLIHLVALVLAYLRYGHVSFMFQNIDIASSDDVPPGYGYGLPVVYLVWLGVVLSLYPLCQWYAGFKARHRWVVLSYL